MSEQQELYITDALEMMGIAEPRQIVTEVSGFVPVFEVVLRFYDDPMTALVFGRMWQYCGMSDGVCRAKLERLADDLKISRATVIRHIEKLCTDGYMIDQTPDRRNRPHEYKDGGKVIMKSQLTATVSERNARVSQKNVTVSQKNVTVSERYLIKQDNTTIKENNGDKSPTPIQDMPIDWQIAHGQTVILPDQTAAKMTDASNLLDMGCAGAGALGLAFMTARKMIIPEAKIKGNRKAAREMLEMGVKPEHVTQAVNDLTTKGMTVIDLFSVSKTAIDLANKIEVYNPNQEFGL